VGRRSTSFFVSGEMAAFSAPAISVESAAWMAKISFGVSSRS
jgi:hypothetical protein